MGRAVVVGALILLLVGLPIAAFWACLDCPECDPIDDCLRCGGQDRLTPFGRVFGRPSHPAIQDLVLDRADPEARLRELGGAELLAWDGMKDSFELDCVVPLKDGTLLLALAFDEEDAGTPCRFLLFERNGELRDRLDLWLLAPTRQTLELQEGHAEIHVRVTELRGSKVPRSPNLVVRRGEDAETQRPLPAEGPVDPGRIVATERRLELVGP